jgi:2-dehydropantoate 2-reductase
MPSVPRVAVPRVAVIGPGAIGATFAAAVQQAGHADLTLCARRPLGPITVARAGQPELVLTAPVITDPQQVPGRADWVFLAVKAHQVAGTERWLKALTGPGSVVVVLQNGVEQRHLVGPLAQPGTEILPAAVWCPAELAGPDRVVVRGQPRLSVPAGRPGHALAALLAGAAQVDVLEDFTTEAWRKLCVNAVAGLQVLAGRRAAMFGRSDIAALARDLAAECVAVARAEGARLDEADVDEVMAYFAALPPDQTTSILSDREAGRRLEWDARNAVVRRLGAKHGIATPVSDVIVPLLAAASGEEL